MRSSSYSTGVCKELSLYSSVTVDEHYHAIIFLAHFVERRIKEGGEFMVAGRSYPVTPRDIVKSREHLETIHQSDPSYLRQGMLAEPQMSQLTRIAIIEMAWGLPIDACIPSSLKVHELHRLLLKGLAELAHETKHQHDLAVEYMNKAVQKHIGYRLRPVDLPTARRLLRQDNGASECGGDVSADAEGSSTTIVGTKRAGTPTVSKRLKRARSTADSNDITPETTTTSLLTSCENGNGDGDGDGEDQPNPAADPQDGDSDNDVGSNSGASAASRDTSATRISRSMYTRTSFAWTESEEDYTQMSHEAMVTLLSERWHAILSSRRDKRETGFKIEDLELAVEEMGEKINRLEGVIDDQKDTNEELEEERDALIERKVELATAAADDEHY
ncbi:hypothetical protein LTS18_012848 [Coniosporium uncinatum]|uniref:Uncharacterized protein n=1 Tax=Coniosporium uncinatum TaxID=93489 RepID=A0ACC3DVT5_9PEZI|nr:hypothetical protein LTS18_012848 [Coniosporium uncinatum]